MPDPLDRVGTLGADSVPGLTNHRIMKSSPVWAQLAGEVAALQILVKEQKAQYNALLAKLDSDAGITDTDYAATVSVTARDPAL